MNVIEIEDLYLGYGNEEVLSIDHASFPQKKIIGLLGPSGGGKSSLLSAIAKLNTNPSYWQQGKILFQGSEYNQQDAESYIGLVPQKARLYTGTILENFIDGLPIGSNWNQEKQIWFMKKVLKRLELWSLFKDIVNEPAINQSMGIHKLLLIAREVAKNPQMLLMDEVLANTSIKDEKIIIELIRWLSGKLSVFIITHNKTEAQSYCDYIALISGGVLHEVTACGEFFEHPKTEIGKEFLSNGSAWYINHQKTHIKQTKKAAALRKFSNANEFFWVKGEQLGGMQKPGLLTDIELDLSIMVSLHVNYLVSLTIKPIDVKKLNEYGIHGLHFPIKDMGVPDLAETEKFLKNLNQFYQLGQSIVFHCKAGMGRTGIMLACSLVYCEHFSAIKAIESIRKINHKYIQTDEQYDFVGRFERYLKNNNETNHK